MASPIVKVDGKSCPCPSVYEWGLQDVSDSKAGRDKNAKMHKLRKAQKVTIKLSWAAPDRTKTAQILNLFNPEYIRVEYEDPMKASGTTTKEFYVGDRSAPLKTWWNGNKHFSQLSFDIIER